MLDDVPRLRGGNGNGGNGGSGGGGGEPAPRVVAPRGGPGRVSTPSVDEVKLGEASAKQLKAAQAGQGQAIIGNGSAKKLRAAVRLARQYGGRSWRLGEDDDGSVQRGRLLDRGSLVREPFDWDASRIRYALGTMKVRCLRRQLPAAEAAAAGIEPRAARGVITPGRVYLVLGIEFTVGLAHRGTGVFLQIHDDSARPTSAPLALFEIVDDRVSPEWVARELRPGMFALQPAEFFEPFFHNDLEEGDPSTTARYRRIVGELEAAGEENPNAP